MGTRVAKPYFVKISEEDWHALTPEQQSSTEANFKGVAGKTEQSRTKTEQSRTKCLTSNCPAMACPSGTGYCSGCDSRRTTIGEAPKLPELTGIRGWTESVRGIPGDRLRNCIIYLLDVKKDAWYTPKLTRGFVLRQAERINQDTPDDYVYDSDPLIRVVVKRTEDGDTLVSHIRRMPKNEAERTKIRSQFGVSSKTIKYLAKKNCQVCKGTGLYETSSYPGDPVYSRLTETIECKCSYE